MAADILAILIKTNLAAAAAVLAALLLRKPLRKLFGARTAYLVWLVVPLAIAAVVLPARTVVLPYVAAPERLADIATSPSSVALGPVPVEAPALSDGAALVALWLAGAVISFGLLAWSQVRFMRSLGGVVREGRFLRAKASGPGPAVVGAIFPRIVLPADFEARYDVTEQKVVLAHEDAHLASGDAVVNAAVALAQCLFWFNPLIHLAARLIRVDQELACDAAVLAAHPGDRRPYGEALLKTQIASTPLPLGCYWPAGAFHPLKERIAMLKLETPSRARRLCGGAGVLALCLGAGVAAWAAQPATVTLAPTNSAAPAAPAPVVAPVRAPNAEIELVTPTAIAASDKAVDVAANPPVALTQTVTTAGGRTFQRVNAPPSPTIPSRGTLVTVTPEGAARTFIVMRPPPLRRPSSVPKPTWWKPVPLEPLVETEDVRQAKALIDAAVTEQDSRLAAGRPAQPLTPQLEAALAMVPKFYREAAQRDIEITRLELRQTHERNLAQMDEAIAKATNDPVERQKRIEIRERYLARFPQPF